MAEPHVSPLLDQMTVGECISSRNGISCYEVRHASGQEFILKCVSVPESPEKVSALILSGAYADATAANEYFRRVADDLKAEYEAGRQIAECVNFLQFLNCQIEAKETGVGYDVYLLATKSLSLKAYLADNAMSHLRAVNLGIDLCVVLDALRSAGYVFENIKPENIFVAEDGSFALGDLGLASTQDMRFSSLPEQYISPFTAPELYDIMESINTTIDTYALGLLLYRIYNGNHGAFEDEKTSAKAADSRRLAGETLPVPLYADYELAEIILKACAFKIEDRYQTPDEMRQALVDYAQRNDVTDALIVPPIISDPEPLLEELAEEAPEPVAFTDASSLDEDFKQHFSPDTASLNAIIATVRAEEAAEELKKAAEIPEAAAAPQIAQATAVNEEPETTQKPEPAQETEITEETALTEVPEEIEEANKEAIKADDQLVMASSDDVQKLLAASDAILNSSKPFETPEAVLVTEEFFKLSQPDITEEKEEKQPLPELVVTEIPQEEEKPAEPEQAEQESEVEAADEPAQEVQSEKPEVPAAEDEPPDSKKERSKKEKPKKEEKPKKKHSPVGWIILAVVAVLLAAAVYVYCFTDFGRGLYHYFIRIDTLSVSETTATSISVNLTSKTENPPVSLVCQDIYGNPVTAEPDGETVTFNDLMPGTLYTITVKPVGTHKILGATTCSATTSPAAEVLSFTVSAGTEEGAVQLNLVVKEGTVEPESWQVTYAYQGGEESVSTFSGHSTQLIGLEVGKEYVFKLNNAEDFYVIGETTATYTPVKAVTAEDLHMVSFIGDTLTVGWSCTSDMPEKWTIICTDADGNETTKDTTDCEGSLNGLKVGEDYQIELSAVGLFQSIYLDIPQDLIYVDSMSAEQQEDGSVVVKWDCKTTPEGGWLLVSSLGESDALKNTTTATESAATLRLVPNAAYTLQLNSADGRLVVGKCTVELKTAQAGAVNLLNVKTDTLTLATYKAPEAEVWGYKDLGDQTQSFTAETGIAFVLSSSAKPAASKDSLTVLCIVRDKDGKVVDFSSQTLVWNDMWPSNRYTAKLPRTPENPGEYTLEIYFSYKLAKSTTFKVE